LNFLFNNFYFKKSAVR